MLDVEGKCCLIHTIGGIIFGYFANNIYTLGLGMFSGVATLIFIFIGSVIFGHISAKILGEESIDQKQWFSCGVLPFFLVAIIVWILKYNGII
ncbi:EMC6-like membrane protein [Methanocaldococcus sp.]